MKLTGLYRSQTPLRMLAPETRMPLASRWLSMIAMIAMMGSCLAAVAASGQDSPDSTTVSHTVEFRDGRLSVSAKNISIPDLMQLVGAEADFDVVAYGDLSDHTGSWLFPDLPLAEAIRKLLRDTNTIITYSPASHANAEPLISRIYLLGSSSAKVNPIRIQTVKPGLDSQLRLDQAQADDVQSRIAAIDRSEGLTDEITLENLVFALQHDPDPEVRLRAITALEGIGGAAAVSALEAGMGDTDTAVRKKLVQTLGKIDDERIPLWLGQVLMGDPEPEVRLAALQAVARKEGDIARIFLQAATGDSSNLVSEAALQLTR